MNTSTYHHIILRSQGGSDDPKNGISFGQRHHDPAHGVGGFKIDGVRVTGRQYMIMVLDRLVDSPDYRWGDVHEELKRKEGVPV